MKADGSGGFGDVGSRFKLYIEHLFLGGGCVRKCKLMFSGGV